jgi:hypothetical protein
VKKRSKFSLSNYKLFSSDMGYIVPCGCFEVLPGDTVQHATSALIRLAPLVTPVMHPLRVKIHHWYVPYRLIWEDFEEFITGGPDGADASVYPTIDTGGSGASVGSLLDYLGVPPNVSDLEVSALPVRAYNFIFNERYRDQDLVTAQAISVASGPDTTTATDLKLAAWEKDYFTSSRPWEQKGPAVTLPLGDKAELVGLGVETGQTPTAAASKTFVDGTGEVFTTSDRTWKTQDMSFAVKAADSSPASASNPPEIYADLSNATAATVNTIREAFAKQRFEEARARYGSRFTEYLRYLGVRSSDARLQEPEYLGGGKQTIQFSEVLQTAEGTDPVGTLRGHGIGAMRSNRYRRFFEEHGIVMSTMTVRPKAMYSDGLARMWNRRVKEDFWQKELQHIGQQEVENQEVYADASNPTGVFGYQDRYDEYRGERSTIAGEMRTVLNDWHMARQFGSEPALNSDFINCDVSKRNFAAQTNNVIYAMCNHNIVARRLLVKKGSSYVY